MSYTDADITRADQVDQGAGTHRLRAKQRNSKAYQVVMPNDVDGIYGSSGGPLVKDIVASNAGGAVYRIEASMGGGATNDFLWILMYDKAGAPTGGDTPFAAMPVYKAGKSVATYPGGRPLTNGLSLVSSTSLSALIDPGESVIRYEFNVDELGTT